MMNTIVYKDNQLNIWPLLKQSQLLLDVMSRGNKPNFQVGGGSKGLGRSNGGFRRGDSPDQNSRTDRWLSSSRDPDIFLTSSRVPDIFPSSSRVPDMFLSSSRVMTYSCHLLMFLTSQG